MIIINKNKIKEVKKVALLYEKIRDILSPDLDTLKGLRINIIA